MTMLLDLCCKAGGAAMGYYQAGFDIIVGVDIEPQRAYPFIFIQADVTELPLSFALEFDAVHISPPCQPYSTLHPLTAGNVIDILAPMREWALASGLPFVIENVPGAPLYEPLTLCGTQFGLGADGAVLKRHRLFESNIHLEPPAPCTCRDADRYIGVYGHGGGKGFPGLALKQQAMGINWMSARELAQAIPPAYTEHVGRQLIAHIEGG